MRIVKAKKNLFVFSFEGKGNLLRNLSDRMMKHSSFVFFPTVYSHESQTKLGLL